MAASKISAWIKAIRLRTLPLATAAMLLGNLLALKESRFSWAIAILSYLTAVFLQILSNLANDYGDTRHGADNVERIGPQRMTQAGMLTSAAIRWGIILFVFMSLMTGCLLLFFAIERIGWQGIAIFFALGVIAIAAAVAYTATRKPYGYRALGDISVFIFFGLLAVGGCYFLQNGKIEPGIFMPAAGMGLLCTAVLNINNIRDMRSDSKAGKRTVAILLGEKGAKLYQWLLVCTAVLLFTIYLAQINVSSPAFLFLLPSGLLLFNTYQVWVNADAAKLNPRLKQLAISILVFTIVYCIGLNY